MDENLEWVTVRYQGVDYNRYKVSEYGTVWDLKLGREVATSVNTNKRYPSDVIMYNKPI